MAKARKAATPAPRKSAESLLVASKVRAAIKDAGYKTSGDAMEGLNAWVGWLIQQATARAGKNDRKTVRAHDFGIF
jgi:histone H3/H4